MGQRHPERPAVLEQPAERRRTAVRLDSWQSLLSDYLSSYNHRFEYGQRDCFLFTAGAIKAQTGVDVTEAVHYTSRRESLSAIRSFGPSLADAFAAVVAPYGILPSPVALCHRGDPVVIRQGQRGASLGIVSLTGRDIITVANSGLTRLPLARAFQGFKL